MSESDLIWKLEQKLCRCCHAEGVFEDLSKPRELNGITEIYSNMLKACFQIVIDSVTGPLSDMTYTICEACILRLRDAYDFMKQVQNAEIKFKDYYNRNAIKGIHEDCDEATETEQNNFTDHEECSLNDDFFMHLDNEDLQNSATEQKEKTKGTKIKKVKNTRDVKKVINKLKKAKKKVDKNETDASEDKGGGRAPIFRLQSQDYKKDGDGYICGHCNKRYKTTSLRRHVKSKHYKILNHKCRLCNSQFNTIPQYTLHKLKVHNIDDRHECKACNKMFNSRRQLKKHTQSFHMLGVKEKCDLCDYECFSVDRMNYHKLRHKKVKDHHCSFCKKSFVRKNTLKLHERIHTGEKRSICKECGQAFVQKASLNYHMMKYHPNVNF